MFRSKDVCILKMTIDFNGSMSVAPFLIPYACVSVRLCVRMRVHSYKQICAKGKKKTPKAPYFEKGSTSVWLTCVPGTVAYIILYTIFSPTREIQKPPRVLIPKMFEPSHSRRYFQNECQYYSQNVYKTHVGYNILLIGRYLPS